MSNELKLKLDESIENERKLLQIKNILGDDSSAYAIYGEVMASGVYQKGQFSMALKFKEVLGVDEASRISGFSKEPLMSDKLDNLISCGFGVKSDEFSVNKCKLLKIKEILDYNPPRDAIYEKVACSGVYEKGFEQGFENGFKKGLRSSKFKEALKNKELESERLNR